MKETKCWTCRRPGTGSCSWDLNFTPVEGWTATPTMVAVWAKGAQTESYIVHACPKYVPELYSTVAKRPGYGALLSDELLENYIFKGFSDLEISEWCGMTVKSVRRRRIKFLLEQAELEEIE